MKTMRWFPTAFSTSQFGKKIHKTGGQPPPASYLNGLPWRSIPRQFSEPAAAGAPNRQPARVSAAARG